MKIRPIPALLAMLSMTILVGAKPAAADSASATLFFRDSVADEPAPDGHQTGDTFAGGTWQRNEMDFTNGVGAVTKSVTINQNGNPSHWRLATFLSAPLAAQTIEAGGWTVELSARENVPGVNAYLRLMAYTWKPTDSLGSTIFGPTTHPSELPISMTSISMFAPGAAVLVEEGDRIAVDVLIETQGATSGFVDVSWNDATRVGRLVAPSVIVASGSPVPASTRGGLALVAGMILFLGVLAVRRSVPAA